MFPLYMPRIKRMPYTVYAAGHLYEAPAPPPEVRKVTHI